MARDLGSLMPLRINSSLTIPEDELHWSFGPSGGPGGQHANTANTRAELVFEIEQSSSLTGRQREILVAEFGQRIRIAADESRSQRRNRDVALSRLAERLQRALKPKKKRRPTKPTRGAKERRLKAKRHQSERKAGRNYRGDDH